MPRVGGVYSVPTASRNDATSGTTISSAPYKALLDDLETDLNAARPVTAGGTGATTAAGARTALGVQQLNANLTSLAGLTFAENKGLYTTGANTAALFDLTAAGRALLDDPDAAAQRATLGLGTAALMADSADTDLSNDPDAVARRDIVKAYVDTTAAPTWTEGTVTATTSGTAIDFTSLPSGLTEIEIWFDQVSGNSSDDFLVQIGTGGTPTTSGYDGGSALAGSTQRVSSSAGFPLFRLSASYDISGVMRFYCLTGNLWVSSHSALAVPGDGSSLTGGGVVALSGSLDNLRLTSIGGTQNFNNGQVRLRYR